MAGKAKTSLTRDWLISQNCKVFVNGVDTADTDYALPKDDDVIEIYHYSKRLGWSKLNSTPNITNHERGIKRQCTYHMIGFYADYDTGKKMFVTPYHRFLYAWFYGKADAGMDICHRSGGGTNNLVSNLFMDTHKNNLATRDGAINQYGLRKRDR